MGKIEFKIELQTLDSESYQTRVADFIKEIVAQYFGKTMAVYDEPGRKREALHVKHVAMYFIMKNTKGISLAKTGAMFRNGNTLKPYDHATVLHAVNKLKSYLAWDKVTKKQLEELEQIISHKGLAGSTTVDLEKDYYFIDLNNLTSLKIGPKQAILFTGWDPEDIERFKNLFFLGIQGLEQRKHLKTGMYIMEKPKPLKDNKK